MKRSLTLLTFALLLVVPLAAQQQRPASLAGIVTTGETNEPVHKATVELRRSGNTPSLTTTTDEFGKFTFEGLSAGEYRLFVFSAGFVAAEYGQRQVGGPGQRLTLQSGQQRTGLRIGLTRGAIISGRVTDRGLPSGNTPVNVFKVTYEFGHRIQQAVSGARTDDRGEFRVFWLPPGRYYVWAGPLDYEVDAILGPGNGGSYAPVANFSAPGRYVLSTRSLHPSTRSTERHLLTYYGNTTDMRKALPIDLAPGGEARGIDIQADMRPALHVRGTVTGIPDAAPGQVVRATVTLLPDDASSFIALPIVQTQPNGAFEMEHVSPGAYTVYATAGNLQSRVSIDVRDHDVNGVDVALSTGLNLSGRVFIENPTDKVGPGSVNAVSVALVTDPALGGFLISATATASVTGPVPPGSDGTFVLPGATAAGPLPGKYRVYVPPLLVPASGWSAPRVALPQALTRTTIPPALETAYVKSIRLGDRDVLNDGLYLESSTREPLTIVIGTDAATVEGTVVDHERKPIDSATVVLVPETGLKFQTNHRYVGTDTAGRFQFKNIAPGEYRVFAWEYAAPGAWQDPDFVRSHESLGQLVRIPAAKTTTLSLTSIP